MINKLLSAHELTLDGIATTVSGMQLHSCNALFLLPLAFLVLHKADF